MPKPITYYLYQLLEKEKDIELILQVGRNRKHVSTKIDLLALFRQGDIAAHGPPIARGLANIFPSKFFCVYDDSVRFSIGDISGGVAVLQTSTVLQNLTSWGQGINLEGEQRPWATGYWLPEALYGDLATAKVVYDPFKKYQRIHTLTHPYPTNLAEGISRLCINEIEQKIDHLKKSQITKHPIEINLTLSNIIAALTRLAFAKSFVYLRGFKDLDTQSKLLKGEGRTLYRLTKKLVITKDTHKLLQALNKRLHF